nr:hypothetical protein [Corynebacterium lactis]
MRVSASARRFTATIALLTSISLGGGALVACGGQGNGVAVKSIASAPEVLADDLSVSEGLLDSAEAVVVSSSGEAEQRRAAAIAVAAKLPMLVLGSDAEPENEEVQRSPKKDARGYVAGVERARVEKEIDRLGVKSVLTVGAVDLTGGEGRQIIRDPGTPEGLRELVGVDFTVLDKPESKPSRVISEMDPAKPSVVDVKASGTKLTQEELDRANVGQDDKGSKSATLPKGSPAANKKAVALAAPGTGLASIATARAAGLDVEWLPVGDARATSESMKAARGGKSIVALGSVFGDTKRFEQTVALAKDDSIKELPGGGTLLFPGRHFIATYGHPGAAPLGVMGEQEPAEAVETAKGYVKQYEKFADDPVLPAFEIIASVAQASPGPRGDYSEPATVESLKPYVDAMTKAGGYVIIDLQPGSADFLEQAKIYEELLKMPNVGLALDAEWKMEPGQVPATEVGHVDASEINRVAQWLAKLTRDNKLPQKMLLLHQFQLQMIRNRESLDLSHPELSFVLHADGHGTPEEKFETWNVLLQDLQPEIFEAWKNFIDEDKPMFTPEETMNIEPRPWLVTYQ